jgi:hypothetical protein
MKVGSFSGIGELLRTKGLEKLLRKPVMSIPAVDLGLALLHEHEDGIRDRSIGT